MIYRVCLALNKLDWSPHLPLTDDFTVMASDWSAGFFIEDDAKASVPFTKRRKLSKQGFFFNPEALPVEKIASGSSIKSIGKKSTDEQIEFWTSQLDGLYADVECEAKASRFGSKRVVKRLVKLGEPGVEALLKFVEAKGMVPEWLTEPPQLHFWQNSPRTEVLDAVVAGIQGSCDPNPENERRLWNVFEEAVKANAPFEFWGNLPARLAFCIQELFLVDGSWKYDYWVIRSYKNEITSLAQIREQRDANRDG